jgi:hypothetical protein
MYRRLRGVLVMSFAFKSLGLWIESKFKIIFKNIFANKFFYILNYLEIVAKKQQTNINGKM